MELPSMAMRLFTALEICELVIATFFICPKMSVNCMKEDCVEKMFRDIKAYCIFEGTNQIQKIIISGAVLAGKAH